MSTPKVTELVNGDYIMCPKGHKMFVVWVPAKNQFAFTCDECLEISPLAASVHGTVGFRIVQGVVRRS